MSYLSFAEAMKIATVRRDRGEAVVIAAVISPAAGSPPGGARAVIGEGGADGSLGRALDLAVQADALSALAERRSGLRSYKLNGAVAEPARLQRGDVDVFLEVLSPAPRLIVVGAGHIAQPLVQLAHILEFDTFVVDDRERYASRERFPDAREILVGSYPETLARLPLDRESHVVLVTRGHVHDQACLELVLAKDVAYVGMIGSKLRVRTVLRHLREKGYDPAKLEQVHAPIGLDIGSQTPAEIALAILAEIVSVRRGRHPRSLSLRGAPRG